MRHRLVMLTLAAGVAAAAAVPGRSTGHGSAAAAESGSLVRATRGAQDPTAGLREAVGTDTARCVDAQCLAVFLPLDTLLRGDSCRPQALVANGGNTARSFPVRMSIGAGYTARMTSGVLAPGARCTLAFAAWRASGAGSFAITCSTELDGDMNPDNDRVQARVFVRVLDAGVLAVRVPSGEHVPGSSVTPVGTWHNYGNTPAGFTAWMLLSDPADSRAYARSIVFSSVDPGADVAGVFPPCTLATSGNWVARCSTALAGDMTSANDVVDGAFRVGSPDIGVTGITAPAGIIDTGTEVTPSAVVRNFGDMAWPFRVWFDMEDPGRTLVYHRSLDVQALPVGAETTLVFPSTRIGSSGGVWVTCCSAYVEGDVGHANDCFDDSLRAAPPQHWAPGWASMAPVPTTVSARQVRDGGWLVADGWNVFGAKGYKSPDFYVYDPFDDRWSQRRSIPAGAENKLPYRGAAACAGGNGDIYATKGNNTLGFWTYRAALDTWVPLRDVPLGPSDNKVKGGTDMVFVTRGDSQFVYLLKGYKNEFWRYDVARGLWQAMANAPSAANPRWSPGSWLVYDGNRYIFAHKARYHEFYIYNTATGQWVTAQPLRGMSPTGRSGDTRKSRDGSSAAWSGGAVYALKGGNTLEFWQYTPGADTWVELESMPALGRGSVSPRKVKAGGDLTAFADGVLFALKGNKTLELWRYVTGATSWSAPVARDRGGAAAGSPVPAADGRLSLAPNPLAGGCATVRGNLPGGGAVTVRVFDAAGRAVLARALDVGQSADAVLDLRSLRAGVYLVRFDCRGRAWDQKLVVSR